MMDIGYLLQRIVYYMANPEIILPTASDAEQALEIEKIRKAISDLYEGKRRIIPKFQGMATEVICLEIARQNLKEQQGERS